MHDILFTLAVGVLLRWAFERKRQGHNNETFAMAVRAEIGAWFLFIATLVGVIALLYPVTVFFGPFPQVHEW